jgi:hypothetical protein
MKIPKIKLPWQKEDYAKTTLVSDMTEYLHTTYNIPYEMSAQMSSDFWDKNIKKVKELVQ